MYSGYVLAFRSYIFINVLACAVGAVRSLSSPISFSLSLSPGVLFPHSAPIGSDEMLENVGRRFHRIAMCRVAAPEYNLLDVIAFPYATYYAIHGVFSQHMSDIFLFHSPVPLLRFFSLSVVNILLCPVVFGWRLLPHSSNCSPVR